uniref:SHR-BD domain-containing protein n=1 Tax=Macrostomum lignano TaxID=282301 RepID=A0A1I8FLA7_9PLAT
LDLNRPPHDSSSGVNQTSKPPPPPASRTVSARSYADRGRSATRLSHSRGTSLTLKRQPPRSLLWVQRDAGGARWRAVRRPVRRHPLRPADCSGKFLHRFGIVGEFTFVCAGIRCQPLTVRVSERPPFQIEFAADRGFSVESADLEAGESVKWLWRDLPAEMRVLPAELCINCGLRQSDGSALATESGSSGAVAAPTSASFDNGRLRISADRSGPEFKPTQGRLPLAARQPMRLMAHDFLRIIKPDATCYVSHFADLSAATLMKLGVFSRIFSASSVGDSVLLELQGEANKRLTDLKLVGGTALSNDEVENWRKLGNSGDDGESFGLLRLQAAQAGNCQGSFHKLATVRLTDSGSFEPSEIFVQPGDSLLCSWQTGRRTLQFADTIGEVDESSTTDTTTPAETRTVHRRTLRAVVSPAGAQRQQRCCQRQWSASTQIRPDPATPAASFGCIADQRAGQRQIRLMESDHQVRKPNDSSLLSLATWPSGCSTVPMTAVKAVQSLNAKSLDVQSRIVEQCLDSPGPVTVSNVSLEGPSASLVTVPRGGCVLISLSGSGNSEQPNSELHKIDNDGKKSQITQDNDDGVKIDKINPEKFRCIFIGALTPKPQLDWSAGTPQFRCGRAEDAVEPVDVYFTTDGVLSVAAQRVARARPAHQTTTPSTSLDQTICIRAVAISQHRLASQLLTEFCQIDSSINGANDDGEPEQADSAQLTVTAPMGVLTDQWLWFNSIATIRLVEVADGTIEVFWRKSAVPFPIQFITCLSTELDWFATADLLSNELRYNCPCWSTERGPLISMELLADAEDSAAVVWAALPLSRTSALIGYKCGRLVTPEADGQRCRVVIEGCELNRKHSLMVNAVRNLRAASNRLQFRLPLPKPLTAASEVDAAAAPPPASRCCCLKASASTAGAGRCSSGAAADKIAADEMESSSNQQEQEKQNQEEDRSKQNGEKLANKTDEQNKKSADKSRKISKKGGRSGAGASASRLDSIFEPFDSMSANLWRHLRSTVSVAGRRFRQEGGGGGGEAAGSGGEA